jgi:hypothetical protein
MTKLRFDIGVISGLICSPPLDAQPDNYFVPTPRITPYHDPYFEEHLWEDMKEDRDISEMFGW